jgi:hypothetical protein
VPVAIIALLMGIEALRDNQMKMVFRSGHCDIKQATLLLNLGSAFRRQIRWAIYRQIQGRPRARELVKLPPPANVGRSAKFWNQRRN